MWCIVARAIFIDEGINLIKPNHVFHKALSSLAMVNYCIEMFQMVLIGSGQSFVSCMNNVSSFKTSLLLTIDNRK